MFLQTLGKWLKRLNTERPEIMGELLWLPSNTLVPWLEVKRASQRASHYSSALIKQDMEG